MLDGKYAVEINTPFGRKSCTVDVNTQGEKVIADIDVPMLGRQKIEAHGEGDTFSAQGALKLMFIGEIDYSLSGEVVGDDLKVDIKSSRGEFNVKGVRV